MKINYLFILIFFLYQPLLSQERLFNTIIQEESFKYGKYSFLNEKKWDSLRGIELPANVNKQKNKIKAANGCLLNKRIFGWNPYWIGSVYNNYNWALLTDLCYFDYTIVPSNGTNGNTSFNWAGSSAVTKAINQGVNVSLCTTLFGGHSTFLSPTNKQAQSTFYKNIITLLKQRKAKGLNVDFEGLAISNRPDFVSFISKLSDTLKLAISGAELSIDLPSVDWSTFFDASTVTTLNTKVDFYLIMGYDYYWSGSTSAGPTDPLYNFETSYNYTITRSISNYTRYGIKASNLLLAVPYYGREWETVSNSLPSQTTGNFSSSRNFNVVKANISGYYGSPLFDTMSYTPYYAFQVANKWRQCFVNNGYSMEKRFDIVNKHGLGGIGIWALGYDDGYQDFWNAIQNKFSTCAPVVCSDTIYDMGGPNRDYYRNEKYSFTITVDSSQYISLSFISFSVETNFDSLWVYNGNSTSSPIVGVFTGNQLPNIINSSKSALTFKFKSDGATVSSGWKAIYTCKSNDTGINGATMDEGDFILYPNPFVSNQMLEFNLNRDSKISVSISNVLGQKTELITNEKMNSGKHIYLIDANSVNLSEGIYFVELRADEKVFLKKIILIK